MVDIPCREKPSSSYADDVVHVAVEADGLPQTCEYSASAREEMIERHELGVSYVEPVLGRLHQAAGLGGRHHLVVAFMHYQEARPKPSYVSGG